ncbi:hypothetical protein K3725_15945 [Leisingera sp. S132]|uniref:hypothetical protein n=1 Tax=Leisingera sp. S132 TaxID=2867016 RepID=UPI0021A3746E|nr:hypothetical protein [Leisingera sp. S132]UWQ78779.1 hypothetical protein K3725_15945 [Leisingera sp. S132]
MTQEEQIAALDACQHLQLTRYEEAPDTLDLKLVVQEARAETTPSKFDTGNERLDSILGEARSVVSLPDYSSFTVIFQNYIGFSIRDAGYVDPEPGEDFSRKLRTYTSSAFLRFITESTIAMQVQDAPLQHFAVVCTDHVVDVICARAPQVSCTKITDCDQ